MSSSRRHFLFKALNQFSTCSMRFPLAFSTEIKSLLDRERHVKELLPSSPVEGQPFLDRRLCWLEKEELKDETEHQEFRETFLTTPLSVYTVYTTCTASLALSCVFACLFCRQQNQQLKSRNMLDKACRSFLRMKSRLLMFSDENKKCEQNKDTIL